MSALLTTPIRGRLSQTLVRTALLVAVAVLVAGLHPRHRPATLCLFRACTGLPCPLCGGTTAAVRIGHGRLYAAAAASPLAVLGATTFALWPLASRALVTTAGRHRNQLVVSLLVASELWQLHRFLHGI